MTATFSPRKTMLRVDQKNFPTWALFDPDLDSPGLVLLYVVSWLAAYMGWELGQAELALLSKMSLRAAQDNLKRLEQRGFLVARRENGRKFYDLALSPHVLSEFLRQGVEFQAGDDQDAPRIREFRASDTQNPRAGHAESAHPFKNIKEIKKIKNTPLSPLPHGLAPQTVAGSRTAERGRGESFPLESSIPPSEASFHSGRDRAKRAASGRSSRPESSVFHPDFERLWAIWPNRQAKLPAQRMFASLARRGLLPPLETLLQAVRRFRAEDSGWKRNYVPRLDYWLRDERWTDEPRVMERLSPPPAEPAALPVPAVAPSSSPRERDAEEERPPAPMRRETILAIAAKAFCPWSRETVDTMLEQADEFYQGQKERDGKSRVSGQQAAHPGDACRRILAHSDLREAFEHGTNAEHRLPAILPLSGGVEATQCSRPSFFSFGVPFFRPGPGFIHGPSPA